MEPAPEGARIVAERMAADRAGLARHPHRRAASVAVGPGPDADGERDAERRRWFYTPTDHGGLTLNAQRPAQQRRAMALLGAGTSRPGFVAVATVMGLENVLDQTEGFTAMFDRERGRDPGLYYLRVFGDPAGRRRGAGGSAGITYRSRTWSSTAGWSRPRRRSWAATRPAPRCSVRSCAPSRARKIWRAS